MKGLTFIAGIAIAVAVAAAGAYEPEWFKMTVDDNGPVGMMCQIALDAAERPHIVYYDGGRAGQPESGGLKYAYYNGAGWRITKVETGDLGQYCDIAIDSSGHPHISYNRCFDWETCRGQLKYAYYDGSSWHIEVVDDSGYAGLHTSIALDSRDRPHISHREHSSAWVGNLKHSYYDGSSWHIEVVDDSGYAGLHTSIALDSRDRPHISHREHSSAWVGNLKHSYYDGSSWHTEVIDGGADLGYDSSIALDAADHPHISYHYYDVNTSDSRLKYAYYDGSSWHVETVDDSRWTGHSTSLALDSAGRPHISYQEDVTTCLKYAWFDGSRWRIAVVDANDVNHLTSLALDAAGRPHISYCAQWGTGGPHSTSELRYAYFDGAAWHKEVIEASREDEAVGIWNSLALDAAGAPHVAYERRPGESIISLNYAQRVGNYLNYFTATPKGYDALALKWSVKAPLGEQIEGFNLLRREKGEEQWLKITDTPMPGGASGSYADRGLACLRCYEYRLEGIAEGRPRQLGVTEGTTTAPRAYVLYNPRPNPSSSSAVIAFELMDRADVELTVYDLSGRKVATLAVGWLPPGAHECACDISTLPPGVYVYRLTAGDWTGAKKMVVVR